MANLTVNTEKYGQITLNTKPHSDPLSGPYHFHIRIYLSCKILEVIWVTPFFFFFFLTKLKFTESSRLPQKVELEIHMFKFPNSHLIGTQRLAFSREPAKCNSLLISIPKWKRTFKEHTGNSFEQERTAGTYSKLAF